MPEPLAGDASDLAERLERAVDAIAVLTGYPHSGRHDAWVERLHVNLPELRAFAALYPVADLGYLAPPRSATNDDAQRAPAVGAAPAPTARAARDAAEQARRHRELHAFIALADDATIDTAAAKVDQCLQRGDELALAGVPVAIKDLMSVAGFVQTNGTARVASAAPASEDALAVARLREAGAIIIGTTNLHELAYGITSDNPHFGRVVNPRHPAHSPGGSSGGSAAAVAAGIVRIAVGTDTAGSIRIPAACCGVVGFKPSFDAVPRDGAQTLGASLDHVGPIAASVGDAALAFSVLAGQPARVAKAAALAGLRVGVPRRHFFDPVADDVRRAVEDAIARMRDDGARIVDVDVGGIESSAAL